MPKVTITFTSEAPYNGVIQSFLCEDFLYIEGKVYINNPFANGEKINNVDFDLKVVRYIRIE